MLKRLFPDAYPFDTTASSEFRRFTERDLRSKKVAEAQIVLDRLATTELGTRDLRIPRQEVGGLAADPDQCPAGRGHPARNLRRSGRPMS